jgi:hypothetical protein
MHKTKREELFEQLFDQARAVHLFTRRGLLVPSAVLVALEFRDKEGKTHVTCFLRWDAFFRCFIRSGRMTNHQVRKFFPDAGAAFDVLAGRVSRKQRRKREVVEIPDKWPCFNQSPQAFARFVRVYVKKRVDVHDRMEGKMPQLIVLPNGRIEEAHPIHRIGLGR